MALSILLWIYIAFAVGIFIYVLLNLYHIFRFGKFDAPTYFMTGLFLAGYIFILFVSYVYIREIDWQTPIEFFSSNGFSNQ